MKIVIGGKTPNIFVRLEPESHADRCQLKELRAQAKNSAADWSDTMTEDPELWSATVRLEKKP